jgi:hypothetical protein
MMSGSFGPSTSRTRLAKVLYKRSEVRPSILSTNKFKRLVLSEVSSEDMVMFELQYSESEIIGIRYEDSAILEEQSFRVHSKARVRIGHGGVQEGRGQRVKSEGLLDVVSELGFIHYRRSAKYGVCEIRGSEGQCKLFLGEYRSEVVRVYSCIVAIPLFWVDVPTASQSIRFCT